MNRANVVEALHRTAIFLVLAALTACGGEDSSGAPDARGHLAGDGTVRVFASNYPLRYFAERIGGGSVEIVFPIPADIDPAFWSPGDGDIRAVQGADVILLNGASYEKWLATTTLPESRIVDTSLPFSDRYIVQEDAVTHSHGGGEGHSHGETAFTTWVNPRHATAQARAVLDALALRLPGQKDELTRNFDALAADLAALDARFETATADHRSAVLLASHPVYDYFGERYGLRIVSFHWEPGEYPSDEEWEEFAARVSAEPARHMIWEDTPDDRTQARLAEEGVRWAVFRTAMNTPDEGDYMTIMNENADALEALFQ